MDRNYSVYPLLRYKIILLTIAIYYLRVITTLKLYHSSVCVCLTL
jgi:hypothetical protein